MRKIVTILLISFIGANQSFSQFFGESLNSKEIIKQNKIRRETTWLLSALSDSLPLYSRNYDSNGNLISSKSFLLKKAVFLMDTFIYDANNRCIKKIQMDKNGIPETETIYTYDKQGNQRLVEVYRNDSLLHSQKKCYNENNQHISDSSRFRNDSYFESGKFYYDENGLAIKTTIILSPDSIFITTYKYNKKKMLTEKHLSKPNADIITRYSYNSNNQCTEEERTIKGKDKLTKTFTRYSYLPNGPVDRKEEYKNNKAAVISIFRYDYFE